VLDGEIIILENGKPSFEKLQQRMHITEPQRVSAASRRLPVLYVVFDLLYEHGQSIMGLPLISRRERLRELFHGWGNPHVLAADFVEEAGRQYFAAARKAGLEGIMAKRRDSAYLPGKRTSDWLKIKAARSEVFDVLGFVPRGKERIVSSLLLGLHDGRRWTYKGNVGTGFNETQRAEFFHQLASLPQLAQPPPGGPTGAVWRQTDLQCRVRFFEETSAGKLRGPVFESFVS
jgi:ATP-dependent DNA ligase